MLVNLTESQINLVITCTIWPDAAFIQCTCPIGGTSRATLGIPVKRLKISQYIQFYTTDRLWIVTAETILKTVYAVTFLETVFEAEWDLFWYLII